MSGRKQDSEGNTMKVNNRWLYCGLTFLTVNLLFTSTCGMELCDNLPTSSVERIHKYLSTLWTRPRFDGTHIIQWNENHCYEGHYDTNTGVFTAHDGDTRENVHRNEVYFVGRAFRSGDRVACYWNGQDTHLNSGKVVSVGQDKSRIKFNNGCEWIWNTWIHGLTATVSNPHSRSPPQPAPARFHQYGSQAPCTRLIQWTGNKYYEGHYDGRTQKFTAYDGDTQLIRSDLVFWAGQTFEEGDYVACYWTKEHEWLNPGTVTEIGYGFSFIEFDDGSEEWRPNEWIHKLHTTPPWKKCKVVAHKCNTTERAKESLDKGADVLEVDVRFSNDGVAVLEHDNHVKVNGEWRRLSRYNVAELKDMASIATLAEVLEICKGKARLILDVKHEGGEWPVEMKEYRSPDTDPTEQEKAQMIKRSLDDARVDSDAVWVYTSKYVNGKYNSGLEEAADYKKGLEDICPGAAFRFMVGSIDGWKSPNFFHKRKQLGVSGFHLKHTFLDHPDGADFLCEAQKQGFFVDVWTINDNQTTRRRAKSGVNSITTDYPCKCFSWKNETA